MYYPTYPDINLTAFPQYEWMEIYSNVEEAIPPDMPPLLDKDLDLCRWLTVTTQGTKQPDVPALAC